MLFDDGKEIVYLKYEEKMKRNDKSKINKNVANSYGDDTSHKRHHVAETPDCE